MKTFLCFTFEGKSEVFEEKLGEALKEVKCCHANRIEFTEDMDQDTIRELTGPSVLVTLEMIDFISGRENKLISNQKRRDSEKKHEDLSEGAQETPK